MIVGGAAGVVVIAAVAVLFVPGWFSGADGSWGSTGKGVRWIGRVVGSGPGQAMPPRVEFTDVTREAGIDFVHEAGAFGLALYPETIGPGCGFLDFDRDGDQDIFIVNSGRWPHRTGASDSAAALPAHALYRNDGGGRFQEVGRSLGLLCHSYGQGVCFGDVDNDGFEDVYVTCVGRNILYRNLNGERFRDITAEAGVGGEAWSVSAAFLDYDRDGLMDLFVGNYLDWSPALQDRVARGMGMAKLVRFHPKFFDGVHCRLFRNLGNNRFEDVSRAAGIQQTDWLGQPAAKALGVAIADYNADGWPDIAVANDETADFLFQNRGDGTFDEVGARSGMAYDALGRPRGGMGIHWGDYRNDGVAALAIGNFTGEQAALYRLLDRKRGSFEDVAVEEGLGLPTVKPVNWGLFFFDYDLDGRLDFFVNNGHVHPPPDAWVDPAQQVAHAQVAQLFWNQGGRWGAAAFIPVDATAAGSALLAPRIGRGAAHGDYDGDGDLDILLTTNQGSPCLLRNENQTGHRFLRLRLEGRRSNRSAIGTKVRVRSGRTWQRREVTSGSSYASQNELILTFGLGGESRAAEIRIEWPSGAVQRIHNAAADQLMVIVEPP